MVRGDGFNSLHIVIPSYKALFNPERKFTVYKFYMMKNSFLQENEINESEKIFTLNPDSSNFQNQSFLEMLNSGPSRSPSPSRPPFEQEDANNPTLANWSFQNRQNNVSIYHNKSIYHPFVYEIFKKFETVIG